MSTSQTAFQNSNFLKPFSKNSIYSDVLIKNCGISKNFFGEISKYTYVLEKDSKKKDSPTDVVVSIPIEKITELEKNKKFCEIEDKEKFEKDFEDNTQKDTLVNTNTFSNTNNKNYENDCYDPQIHFKYLTNNLNESNSESSQVVKAYRSKHKKKYIKIYEANSINFNENNKYKLFHKCCYPKCNRTFSSSGWLKAHFKEHLKQIHNSLFSKLFNRLVLCNQVQLMNHYNNNFLGLEINKFK